MRARLCVLSLVIALGTLVLSCSKAEPPRAIQVRSTDIVVRNLTPNAWSDVEVWVNDHYRGVIASVRAGQILNVPLDNLVAAYGQRFDVRRQSVFGVLVRARASNGENVRLTYGTVRRK